LETRINRYRVRDVLVACNFFARRAAGRDIEGWKVDLDPL
jgi:hypothetical protein